MAGQYAGLARALISNQLGGRAVAIRVGSTLRCVTAEMVPNILSGGRPVPQLRFVCDDYCASAGVQAKRPSKACRALHAQVAASVPIPIPAGVQVTQTTVGTPYTAGGGGAGLGGSTLMLH